MLPLITLFTPGNRPDLIEKSARFAPDAIIIDLEDSVPAALKERTRDDVAALLPKLGGKPLVRINSEAALADKDIAAVVSKHIYGIVLPVAETPEQVHEIDRLIAREEAVKGLAPGSIRLILLLESALGVHRCFDLVTAAARVESVMFGSAENADLQRDLRSGWSIEGTELLYARSKVLLECRAAKLPYVLDGAFSRITDIEMLRADCEMSRRLGYDGRTLIHPSQIAVAREVYRPSSEEIASSRKLVEAFERAEAEGRAAISFEGQLVDYAMYKRAKDFAERAARQGLS